MGLLDGLKKKAPEVTPDPIAEPAAKPDQEPDAFKWHWPDKGYSGETVRIVQRVNLTEKNVKVEVPEENGYFVKGGYLWEEDGTVRALDGDDVIFEVTKRSKAYKELEEYFRHRAANITIYKRTGEYGVFYRANLKFDVLLDE